MENDLLLAEFLGKPLPYRNAEGNWEFKVEGAGFVNAPNKEALARFLGYNFTTDWNNIMQVVEKIANIKCWSLNATIDWLSEHFDFDGLYDIIDVYNACVEFIKEYNENK